VLAEGPDPEQVARAVERIVEAAREALA